MSLEKIPKSRYFFIPKFSNLQKVTVQNHLALKMLKENEFIEIF